jgi:hypothetical protein
VIVLKTYADLTKPHKRTLKALLVGATQSVLVTTEQANPTSNLTGAPVVHHASVSFLMSLGFEWSDAVKITVSRIGLGTI